MSEYLRAYGPREDSHYSNIDPEFVRRLTAMIQSAPDHVRRPGLFESLYRDNEAQARAIRQVAQQRGIPFTPMLLARGIPGYAAPVGGSMHGRPEGARAADLNWNSLQPEGRDWLRSNAGAYGLRFPLPDTDAGHLEYDANWQGQLPNAPGASVSQLPISNPPIMNSALIGLSASRPAPETSMPPIFSGAMRGFRDGGAVEAALRIAARHTDKNPTDAQKEAGNYAKGKVRIHGLEIAIENPKGSTRSGTDKDGKTWRCVLPAHYGDIKRSEGADGDAVDCYIGDQHDADKVYIVDQIDAKSGRFDEHKCMLSYPDKAAAVADYRKAFSDGKADDRIGAVTEMSVADFKDWVKSPASRKPVGKFANGGTVMPHKNAIATALDVARRAMGGRVGYADGGEPLVPGGLPPLPSAGPPSGEFTEFDMDPRERRRHRMMAQGMPDPNLSWGDFNRQAFGNWGRQAELLSPVDVPAVRDALGREQYGEAAIIGGANLAGLAAGVAAGPYIGKGINAVGRGIANAYNRLPTGTVPTALAGTAALTALPDEVSPQSAPAPTGIDEPTRKRLEYLQRQSRRRELSGPEKEELSSINRMIADAQRDARAGAQELERIRLQSNLGRDEARQAAELNEYNRAMGRAETSRDAELARDRRFSDTTVGRVFDAMGGLAPAGVGALVGGLSRAATGGGRPLYNYALPIASGTAGGVTAANVPLVYNSLYTEPDNPQRRAYEAYGRELPPTHPRRQEWIDYAKNLPEANPVRSEATRQLYDPVALAERSALGAIEGGLGGLAGSELWRIPSRLSGIRGGTPRTPAAPSTPPSAPTPLAEVTPPVPGALTAAPRAGQSLLPAPLPNLPVASNSNAPQVVTRVRDARGRVNHHGEDGRFTSNPRGQRSRNRKDDDTPEDGRKSGGLVQAALNIARRLTGGRVTRDSGGPVGPGGTSEFDMDPRERNRHRMMAQGMPDPNQSFLDFNRETLGNFGWQALGLVPGVNAGIASVNAYNEGRPVAAGLNAALGVAEVALPVLAGRAGLSPSGVAAPRGSVPAGNRPLPPEGSDEAMLAELRRLSALGSAAPAHSARAQELLTRAETALAQRQAGDAQREALMREIAARQNETLLRLPPHRSGDAPIMYGSNGQRIPMMDSGRAPAGTDPVRSETYLRGMSDFDRLRKPGRTDRVHADGGVVGYNQGGEVTEGSVAGPILGDDGGRDDARPISVKSGSFVIPSDCVSGMPGAGNNTLAGMRILEQHFGKADPRAMAAGGTATDVPIRISAGEFVVSPDQVAKLGNGNLEAGHRALEAFVKKVRAGNLKAISTLPPPARD